MNMQKVMAGLCMFYSNTLLCIRHTTAHFTCVLLFYPESVTNLQVFLGCRVGTGASRKLTWRCCLNVMWSKRFNCLTFILQGDTGQETLPLHSM